MGHHADGGGGRAKGRKKSSRRVNHLPVCVQAGRKVRRMDALPFRTFPPPLLMTSRARARAGAGRRVSARWCGRSLRRIVAIGGACRSFCGGGGGLSELVLAGRGWLRRRRRTWRLRLCRRRLRREVWPVLVLALGLVPQWRESRVVFE